MISEANQVALHAAGLTYILGARIPLLPGVVGEWRDNHRRGDPRRTGTHSTVAGQHQREGPRDPDRMIHYQYRHDRHDARSVDR